MGSWAAQESPDFVGRGLAKPFSGWVGPLSAGRRMGFLSEHPFVYLERSCCTLSLDYECRRSDFLCARRWSDRLSGNVDQRRKDAYACSRTFYQCCYSASQLVKVLGNGTLTAKLDVQAHAFSKTAVAAIEAAGGQVVKL